MRESQGKVTVEGESEQGLEGAYDYLVKPAQLDDLVAKMRRAVKRND